MRCSRSEDEARAQLLSIIGCIDGWVTGTRCARLRESNALGYAGGWPPVLTATAPRLSLVDPDIDLINVNRHMLKTFHTLASVPNLGLG